MVDGSDTLGALYIALWFMLSMVLTILNKITLETMGFNYPTILSFFHLSFSTIISWIISLVKKKDEIEDADTAKQKEKSLFFRILLLSLIFASNIICGNLSLSYCSVAFVQIVRTVIPFFTMVLSYLFFGSTFTIHHILSCILVVSGVVLTCMNEINLTALGLIISLFGCFLSAFKTVFTKYILSSAYSIPSAELVLRISPISAIETFGIILMKGEENKVLSKEKPCFTWPLFAAICVSSLIAFFLNLSNFLATQHSSPLTMKVVGCVKQISTIFVSIMIFRQKVTTLNIIGMSITIVGSIYYTLIKPCQDMHKNKERESEHVQLHDSEDQSDKIIKDEFVPDVNFVNEIDPTYKEEMKL